MDTKKPSEALKGFRQFNKTAREVRAKKLGYADAATYIAYLESLINSGDVFPGCSSKSPGSKSKTTSSEDCTKSTKSTKATKTNPKGYPTIHIVDVLDSSGSMMGGKHDAALKGINSGIKDLKESKVRVNYTYTLVDFSTDVRFVHTKDKLLSVGKVACGTRSSTALFDAIGDAIVKVSPGAVKDDKVLVNIYTDGQENSSRRYTAHDISGFIDQLSTSGWTFTFIGTPGDVAYATNILKIHESNTLSYDGTAKGLEKSLTATRSSRTAYSTAVQDGLDVSVGFYKNIETPEEPKKSKKTK